jgi:hypothetical protein
VDPQVLRRRPRTRRRRTRPQPRGGPVSRCQWRPSGRPAGTEAKRRALTMTGTPTRHNENRPPARAGLQANRSHEVRLKRPYSAYLF